jgi:zinc transporter ZupT
MISNGSTVLQALAFNMLAQLSAFIGLGIVLGLGELGEAQQGLLLAFGLGVLLFIALTNIMPKLVIVNTRGQTAAVVLGFALAVTIIGLSMLTGETCGHGH